MRDQKIKAQIKIKKNYEIIPTTKGTDTTAIMLYSLKKREGHERSKDKSSNKN